MPHADASAARSARGASDQGERPRWFLRMTTSWPPSRNALVSTGCRPTVITESYAAASWPFPETAADPASAAAVGLEERRKPGVDLDGPAAR